MPWQQAPASVRSAVEDVLGSTIVHAVTQPTGFSPGVAARLRLADGRRAFVKAVGPEPNAESPGIHRREARVMSAMPASSPVPRLLHFYDEGDGGWVALVFEDVEGSHPRQPWRDAELDRVLHAVTALSESLSPSPLPVEMAGTAAGAYATQLCGWQRLLLEHPSRLDRLDAWSLRHLDALAAMEQEAPAAVEGATLLHFDLRADNILVHGEHVWFVDWPHVRVGAAWVDVVLFAPSVAMQGGPPPGVVGARSPTFRAAGADAVTPAVVATAGFFTHRSVQPPPPGLPTLRAFQAGQAVAARRWVAERTGWT